MQKNEWFHLHRKKLSLIVVVMLLLIVALLLIGSAMSEKRKVAESLNSLIVSASLEEPPRVKYNDEAYTLSTSLYGYVAKTSLDNSWSKIGLTKNSKFEWTNETATQFEINLAIFSGYPVWESAEHPSQLYIEVGDAFYQFVSPSYYYIYIRYQGKFYLEDTFYNTVAGQPLSPNHSALQLPSTTELIGEVIYDQGLADLSYELASNSPKLEGCEAYLNLSSQVIYVKMDNELSPALGQYSYRSYYLYEN